MNKFSDIYIREPCMSDRSIFVKAMQNSVDLHQPWVNPPITDDEFISYLDRYLNNEKFKSFLIFSDVDLVGVINLNEIVRGYFQSCYLGYYGVKGFVGHGFMLRGLNLVLNMAFSVLGLHRLEANIQPSNISSINLVKKCGFILEGYSKNYLKINGVWQDHARYAITYEDWVSSCLHLQ